MPSKFKVDLKQWMNGSQVENLSRHLTDYEKRVKALVKDLNLKSRDARDKSKVQLDRFTSQVRKTRAEVEKNVKGVLQQEGKVLNQKLNDLVGYLKSLALNEKNEKKAAPVDTAKPKAAKAGKKTAGTRRARAKKPAEAGATSAQA